MSTEFQIEARVLGGVIRVNADREGAQRLIEQLTNPQPLLSVRTVPLKAASVVIPAETVDMAQEQILALIVAGGDDIASLLGHAQPLAAVLDALLPLWRPMVANMLDQLETKG